MDCLNEDAKEKNDTFIEGKATLISTGSNLLDTKYKFNGFNDTLIDVTNEYHCHKAGCFQNKYRLRCYG